MQTEEHEDTPLKVVHCSVQSQYVEAVDDILSAHGVRDYVRHPRAQGRDAEGPHRGDKIFPGNIASFWAYVPTDRLEALLDDLRSFREASEAHAHLRAAVLPVEQIL